MPDEPLNLEETHVWRIAKSDLADESLYTTNVGEMRALIKECERLRGLSSEAREAVERVRALANTYSRTTRRLIAEEILAALAAPPRDVVDAVERDERGLERRASAPSSDSGTA
jgi:hypothetical protein